MTEQERLSRRAVVVQGAALLSLAAAAPLVPAWAVVGPGGGAAGVAAWLGDLAARGPQLRRIGEAFLRQRPALGTPAAVLAELVRRLASEPGWRAEGASWVLAEAREDFRAGRVVWLCGWLLAELEAHVCAALLALPQGAREAHR